MNRFFPAVASFIALSLASASVFAADIIDTASTSGTLKTFVTAARAAGLTETLKNSGPYTVFAPSDSAFQKLPSGTLDALMKDKRKLASILSHHILPGKVLIADVKPGETETINGDTVKLSSDNGKVTIDSANVIQSDVEADNGVIHEIDTVVIPGE